MSRKPSVEFEGAIYHVFQMANNREDIFDDPIEKGYFIKQIKEYRMLINLKYLHM